MSNDHHRGGATGADALDLSNEGVDRAWEAAGIAPAIRAMEADETWVVDGLKTAGGESVDTVIERLSRLLSSVGRERIGPSILAAQADIVNLMGHVRTGRALLLFRWLSQASEGAGNQLLRHAAYQSTELGSLLVQRVTTLERRALLARVFSPERFASLMDVLDEIGYRADES